MDPDQLRDCLGKDAEALLAFPQRLFHAFAVGDVGAEADQDRLRKARGFRVDFQREKDLRAPGGLHDFLESEQPLFRKNAGVVLLKLPRKLYAKNFAVRSTDDLLQRFPGELGERLVDHSQDARRVFDVNEAWRVIDHAAEQTLLRAEFLPSAFARIDVRARADPLLHRAVGIFQRHPTAQEPVIDAIVATEAPLPLVFAADPRGLGKTPVQHRQIVGMHERLPARGGHLIQRDPEEPQLAQIEHHGPSLQIAGPHEIRDGFRDALVIRRAFFRDLRTTPRRGSQADDYARSEEHDEGGDEHLQPEMEMRARLD